MVLRVIGGLVVGGFATYGVVKFAETTGIFRGGGLPDGASEAQEPAHPGELGTDDVREAASLTVPLM